DPKHLHYDLLKGTINELRERVPEFPNIDETKNKRKNFQEFLNNLKLYRVNDKALTRAYQIYFMSNEILPDEAFQPESESESDYDDPKTPEQKTGNTGNGA